MRYASQGQLSLINNEVYPVGKTWSFTHTSAQSDGMYFDSDDIMWTGMKNADAFFVEVEYTLVSGNTNGAGILFDWTNTLNGNYRVSKSLSEMTLGEIVIGRVNVASATFVRPSDFTGAFNFNRVYMMANYSTFTRSTKSIKIHRINIRPASAEEIGFNEIDETISAAVQSSSSALASDIGAVASDVTTLSSTVGTLSSTVTTQATTVANLESYLASTYTLRVKSGSTTSELELVAASDVDGTTSSARISADDIILDGTVKAEKLDITELSAVSTNIGTFTSSDTDTGARLVISDAQILVYDEQNILRVKIGDLSQ